MNASTVTWLVILIVSTFAMMYPTASLTAIAIIILLNLLS